MKPILDFKESLDWACQDLKLCFSGKPLWVTPWTLVIRSQGDIKSVLRYCINHQHFTLRVTS